MGPRGTDLYGCHLTTGTHGTGKGKGRFSSSLPAPKVLAKIAWDDHDGFSALPFRSVDRESTLSATCCSHLPASLGSTELSQHTATSESWRGTALSTHSC